MALAHVMRAKLAAIFLILFAVSYCTYLYVMFTVKHLDEYTLKAVRETIFTSYIGSVLSMAFSCSSQVEKIILQTGGFFYLSLETVRILDYFGLVIQADIFTLLNICLITVAFALLIYLKAKKYGQI